MVWGGAQVSYTAHPREGRLNCRTHLANVCIIEKPGQSLEPQPVKDLARHFTSLLRESIDNAHTDSVGQPSMHTRTV